MRRWSKLHDGRRLTPDRETAVHGAGVHQQAPEHRPPAPCAARGSRGLAAALERMILDERIPASVTRGPCMNNCLHRPHFKIQAADYFNLEDQVNAAVIEKIMVAVRAEAERRRALPAEAKPRDCRAGRVGGHRGGDRGPGADLGPARLARNAASACARLMRSGRQRKSGNNRTTPSSPPPSRGRNRKRYSPAARWRRSVMRLLIGWT